MFKAEPLVAADLDLNLALVGRDLQNLYESKNINKAERAYIVLVTRDISGDIRYYYNDLRKLLKDHTHSTRTPTRLCLPSQILSSIYMTLDTMPNLSL
jgi:hypothetical protein